MNSATLALARRPTVPAARRFRYFPRPADAPWKKGLPAVLPYPDKVLVRNARDPARKVYSLAIAAAEVVGDDLVAAIRPDRDAASLSVSVDQLVDAIRQLRSELLLVCSETPNSRLLTVVFPRWAKIEGIKTS